MEEIKTLTGYHKMSDNGLVYVENDISKNNGGSTSYYELPLKAKELQDLIEHKQMSWNIANVFKAMYRYSDDHHSSKIRDLNKAKWFIEREINLIKNKEEQ